MSMCGKIRKTELKIKKTDCTCFRSPRVTVQLTVPAAGHIWTECLSQQPRLYPSPARRCLWPHARSWSKWQKDALNSQSAKSSRFIIS